MANILACNEREDVGQVLKVSFGCGKVIKELILPLSITVAAGLAGC
jgi:hypothetical protein